MKNSIAIAFAILLTGCAVLSKNPELEKEILQDVEKDSEKVIDVFQKGSNGPSEIKSVPSPTGAIEITLKSF